MKKTSVVFLLVILLAFGQVFGQEKKADEKKKVKENNFMMVEKAQPVPEIVKKGFESINGTDAMHHLKFLASDSLEGRDTASKGYQIAAEYVATMFSLWGLKPAGDMPRRSSGFSFRSSNPKPKGKPKRTYLQHIAMKETLETGGSAKVELRKAGQLKAKGFTANVDYQYRGSGSQVLSAPVVFVGYGISEKSIKYDEYKGVDVKGKIVMMLSEMPRMGDKKSPFAKKEIKKKYSSPSGRMSRFSKNHKMKLAEEKGAVAIIMVENSPDKKGDISKRVLNSQRVNDERNIYPGKRRRISLIDSGDMGRRFTSLPTIRVSNAMANEILKLSGQDLKKLKSDIETKLKPNSMALPGVTFTVKTTAKTRLVKSPNVLGYIEGSDPELKKEVIVIGAHLDHLGKRGDYIFNGADDNGSGSVGVMELAEAFALNPVKPKRSVLFALWTGEEKGLLGSRYYVAHPYFPLKKTIANINLDMISRTWDKTRLRRISRMMGTKFSDEEFKKIDVNNFIAISYDANAEDIRKIMKENNHYVGLSLYLRKSKNVMSGGGGSDHMPFGMSKIPWAFFMAAMTKDYHQPSDSVEKISVQLMKSITRLSFLTAFSLANK